MLKQFCDKCGREVKENERVKRQLGRFAVEIMVRVDGTWNAGCLCDKCVVKVVNDGRPFSE